MFLKESPAFWWGWAVSSHWGSEAAEWHCLTLAPFVMACADPLNGVWCWAIGSRLEGDRDCDFVCSSALPRNMTRCSGSSRRAACSSHPPTSLIGTPTTMIPGEEEGGPEGLGSQVTLALLAWALSQNRSVRGPGISVAISAPE